jgi:peroxiredoxin
MTKASKLAAACAMSLAVAAHAQVNVGERAPGFTLLDAEEGEQLTLSSFQGKTVVLEWIGLDCPAVKNLYNAGTVQALQEQYSDVEKSNVAWLTIIPEKAGAKTHTSKDVALDFLDEYGAEPDHVLMDPFSAVTRTWGVERIPKAFIVNEAGDVVYSGAVEAPTQGRSGPSPLHRALKQVLAGEPVENPVTKVTGCKTASDVPPTIGRAQEQ